MSVRNSEGSLVVVDLSNDTIVSKLPPPPIGSAWGRVSPNGLLRATMDEQNSVSLWEVSDGRLLATLRGHSDRIRDVEFSPDNHLIATASDDNTVRLWNAATGQLLDTLRGATRGVTDVQFSPDGRLVVAASADGTARVYYSHLDDVIMLARSLSTRPLGCAERVIYLHESLDCAGE
jgi:WD40 repeat protein